MRFQFYVERPKENMKLGVRYLGLVWVDAPTIITAILCDGLVAKENERILREKGPLHTMQAQDIILSINHCTKEKHGAEMLRMALQGDPQVTFELYRMECDPWDIRRVTPEDHCTPPRRDCKPWARMLNVDPCAVRFTHDRISPSFRDGTPLDSTIVQLFKGQLWHKKIPSIEIVEHNGKWYSLSNRRLYVFRVVRYWYPRFRCKACLYSFNHERVQKMAFDVRLGREETKWVRAFSTTSDGECVHVYSSFRWFQTKWIPRQKIAEDQDASVHHEESSTQDRPLPETTRLEEKGERLTDSSPPEAKILDMESVEADEK